MSAPDPENYDDIPPPEEPPEDGTEGKSKGPNLAQQLIAMAQQDYRLVRSIDSRTYAVPRTGPALAVALGSKKGLRTKLAASMWRRTGQVAGGSALSDCLTILEGEAQDLTPQPVFLRMARHGTDTIVVDLGTDTGHCAVITPNGWTIEGSAPVLFRRSGLIHPFPKPTPGGTLDPLRKLINLTEEDWRLAIGWVVAAYFCHIPHPILFVQGEQGTAKSNLMRALLSLIDPQPGAERTPPEGQREWGIFSNLNWAFGYDNVTEIPKWLSDALCRGATGDTVMQRELHSDEDVIIFSFLRVIAINTIAITHEIRNDLADRLLTLEPEVIEERMKEEEVARRRAEALPGAFAAILDLVSKVLAKLPTTVVVNPPRFADFMQVLAAIDAVMGWETEKSYRAKIMATGMAMIEGDTLARVLHLFAHTAPDQTEPGTAWEWRGGAEDLITLLRAVAEKHALPVADVPAGVAHFGRKVREVAPSLRKVGVDVRGWRTKTARGFTVRTVAPTPDQDHSSSSS
jgi:hypothetical protein